MAVALIGELEQAAELARAERSAAEERERRAGLALEQARTASAQASSRRAGLVEDLEQAHAAEEAAMARLGPTRLAHADAEREAERLADTAAAGSDPAARSIAKARDTVETAAAIVAAHERRVRTLVTEREAAERALAVHDAAETVRQGEVLEGLISAEAERVDATFRVGAAAVLAVERLVEARRALRPREGWKPFWRHGAVHEVARDAALVALAPVERVFHLHGPTVSRGLRSMTRVVGELVECWRAGRGEADPAPTQPREAA